MVQYHCVLRELLMKRKVASLFLVLASLPAVLQAAPITPLHDGWRVQSACKLQATGDTIAAEGFSTDGWLKTVVPSTVLAAQVAAGTIPDPYYGMNLRQIPGASYPIGQNFSNLPMPQDSPYHCGWWYRDEFTAPAASARQVRHWLHFAGINYRAEIWLNGHKIADTTTVAGAYRTYDFDVTEQLKPGKTNVLAVETFKRTSESIGSTGARARQTRIWGCGALSIWSLPERSLCVRRWPSLTSMMDRSAPPT
jgi:exo-1,4-beta-D-glucosaminidase